MNEYVIVKIFLAFTIHINTLGEHNILWVSVSYQITTLCSMHKFMQITKYFGWTNSVQQQQHWYICS